MKVLIACEESQEICKAFRKLGHEAYSCDLLPCSGGHPEWHIKGDVLKYLGKNKYNDFKGWDLAIFHPPCTYICNSGVSWLYNKDKSLNTERWIKLNEATDFFRELLYANIPMKCVENPVPHKYAVNRIGSSYQQLIQPWMFGHGETKATCLWKTDNLPDLKPTNIVKGRAQKNHNMVDIKGKKLGWNTKEIKFLRSKTYLGIAKAMAEQWGGNL